jgi:flagellar hook-associated protein 1 FlgK
MSDLLSIGLSGINAAQIQLATVSNNISNASTPGYTEQSVTQAAYVPQTASFGFVGMGVSVTGITRNYNKYLSDQVQAAQATSSYSTTLSTQLSQIDNMMGNSSSGLNTSLQNFFSSMQSLSSDPASVPDRQDVLSNTQSLVTEFQAQNTQLQQIQSGTNSQIQAAVTSINNLAGTIASLNQRIVAQSGNGAGAQPNTLLDQRDEAMQQLNQLVGASYVQQSNGSYDVFIGNGQTLVQDNSTMPLSTQTDPTDTSNLQLIQPNPNGTNTVIPNSLISGGSLGALMNFRDGTLLATQKSLGNMAIDLSTSMNYQQAQGLDLNGNAGSPLFSDLTAYASNPENAISHMSVLLSDPSTIAAASDMTASAVSPSGSTVSVTSVSPTLPASYSWASTSSPPLASSHPSQGMTSIVVNATSSSAITATINGGPGAGTYNVVSDPAEQNGYQLMTTGSPAQAVGVAFTLSGQMQTGMSFTITPNTAATMGTGDNSNLLQMLNLQTAPVVDDTRNGSTAGLQSFQNAYTSATSVVGNATSSATQEATVASNTLEQATTDLSNMSGVDLNQEAANLVKYQQAYQAAAKVISTAQTLFAQILQLG